MRYGQSTTATSLIGSFTYLLSHISILNPYIEVYTSNGALRGAKTVARNGQIYYEFLGIPYAKPPIGNLRFEPPMPPENWRGVRDATNYGISCIQYEVLTHFLTGGEDCLTLNVFTNDISENNRPGKPVILFIHGGLFMSGLSFLYRAKYFMEEEIVLVTFNYRVNSFGFLNTEDGIINGNMGLKDQVMALKWIKENIANFGGNPDSITLLGQSAGGASAHYHMLSRMSKGLFHNVISMSGTSVNRWARSVNPRQQANTLAQNVGCPTHNTTLMAACLKSVNYYKIIQFHKEYLNPVPDINTIFSPSIETITRNNQNFLTEDPIDIMKKRSIPNQVPWLTGVTNAEGVLGSGYLLKTTSKVREVNEEWEKVTSRIFEIKNRTNRIGISSAIREFYLKNEPLSLNNAKEFSDLYSDYLIYKDFHQAILMHLQNRFIRSPVYLYYYTYEGNYGLGDILFRMAGDTRVRILDFAHATVKRWIVGKAFPSKVKKYGVCHADDLIPLFNLPVIADEISPGSEDYVFSKELVSSWVYFAKHGKPRPFFGVKWPQLHNLNEDGTLTLLELSLQPKMIKEPFKNRIDFWEKILS